MSTELMEIFVCHRFKIHTPPSGSDRQRQTKKPILIVATIYVKDNPTHTHRHTCNVIP